VAHLLRAAGATVFVDAEGIPTGEEWDRRFSVSSAPPRRILVF